MIIRKRRQKKALYNKAFFFMDSDETCGGRRIVRYEFPYRETPYLEDLGRKALEWTLTGFIDGINYIENRNKLISELEKGGVGELVHPYQGKKMVRPLSYRLRESNQDSGISFFTLHFTEEGIVQPQFKAEQDKKLNDANKTLLEKTAGLLKEVSTQIENASDKLRVISDEMEGFFIPLLEVRESIENFQSSIGVFKDTLNSLISEPTKLFSSITNLFGIAKASFTSVFDQMGSFLRFSEQVYSKPYPHTEDNSIRQAFALVAFSYAASNIVPSKKSDSSNSNLAQSSQSLPLDTHEVELIREKILATSNQIIESLDDVNLIHAIYDIRAEALLLLEKQGKFEKKNLVVPRPTSSLLFSYENFGTIQEEPKLTAKNSLIHPGFMPEGTLLELSGGDHG